MATDLAREAKLGIRVQTQGVDEASRGLKGLASSAKGTEAGLAKLKAGLQPLGSLLSTFRTGVSSLLGPLGTLITALTLTAVVAGQALAAFAPFQHQLSMVSTMLDEQALGLGAYNRQLDSYGKGLRSISVEMGESTATLSKGLYDILSASVAPAKALDVLAVSAKAAQGGFTTTAVAADLVTSALNAYGLEADKAGRVSDIAFATVARGKLTFEELATNLGKVSPAAAQAGVSLEQLGAMLATVTRQGIRTEQASTALNSLFMQFARQTDQQTKAWAEVTKGTELAGTAFNTTLLVGENLFKTLGVLSRATEKQRLEVAGETTALLGLNAMMRDTAGLHQDLVRTTNSAGEAQRAYKKTVDDLVLAENRAKMAQEALLSSLGELLAPAVTEYINSYASGVGTLAEAIQSLDTDRFSALARTAGDSAKAFQESRTAYEDAWNALEDYRLELEKADGDKKQELAAVQKLAAKYPDLVGRYNSVAQALENVRSKQQQYLNGLKTELLLRQSQAIKDAEKALKSFGSSLEDIKYDTLDRLKAPKLRWEVDSSAKEVANEIDRLFEKFDELETLKVNLPIDSDVRKQVEEAQAQVVELAKQIDTTGKLVNTEIGKLLKQFINDHVKNVAVEATQALQDAYSAMEWQGASAWKNRATPQEPAKEDSKTIIEARAAAERTLLQVAEDSLAKRLKLIDLEAAAQTRAMQAKIDEGQATEADLTAIKIEADAKRQAAGIEWGRKEAEDRKKVESEVLEAVEALGQSAGEREVARLRKQLEEYRAQGQAKAEVVEGYENLIAARQEEIQKDAAARQLKIWEENARLTADKLNLRADLERDISDQVKELTLDELSFKLEMEKKWLEEKLKLNETASAGLEEEIRKLYKLRIGKILDEHAEKHGSVADKVMKSWADTDENIARTTENALRSVQDMFTDTWLGLIKGEIDSFDDFLDSALDNALNIFANWLSQMGTLWLTSNIASLFGQGEGMSLGDALGSLLGKAGAAAASNSGSGAGKEAAGNAAGAAAKEGGLSGAGITTGIGAAAGAAAGGYAGSKLGESIGGDTGGMIGGLAGTIAGGYLGKLAAGYLAEYLGLAAAAQTATASLAGGGVLTATGTLGTSAVTGLSGSATIVGSGAAAGAGTAAAAGTAGAAGSTAAGSAAGASAAGMGAAGALTATGIGAILAAIMVAGNTIMRGDPDTPQDARRRLETTIEDLKRQGGFGVADEWSFNGYTNQRAAMLMGDAGFSGTGMDELKSMLAEAGVAWDEFEDRVADFDLSAAFKKDARQLGGGTNSAAGLERAARELAEAWGISLEDALDEVWGHSNLNLGFATNTDAYEKAKLAIEQTSDGLSALSMNVPGINDVTNAVIDLGNGMALTEVPLNNFAMGTENSIQSMWGAVEASGALTGALEGTSAAALTATEVGTGLYSLTMQLGETSLETTASLDVFKEGVGFAAQSMLDAGDAAFSLGELIGGLPTEHTINVTTRYTTVGTPSEVPLGGDGESAGDIPGLPQRRGGPGFPGLAPGLPLRRRGTGPAAARRGRLVPGGHRPARRPGGGGGAQEGRQGGSGPGRGHLRGQPQVHGQRLPGHERGRPYQAAGAESPAGFPPGASAAGAPDGEVLMPDTVSYPEQTAAFRAWAALTDSMKIHTVEFKVRRLAADSFGAAGEFTLRASDHGGYWDGLNYFPPLLKSIPSVRHTTSELNRGVATPSFGTLELAFPKTGDFFPEEAALWRAMQGGNYIWYGREVSLRVGGPDLDFQDWAFILIGYLGAPSFSREGISLPLFSRAERVLRKRLPHQALDLVPAWQANTAYALVAGIPPYVYPTDPADQKAFHYVLQVAGTSGAAEPDWPETPGETVTDGTCTWKCQEFPAQNLGKPRPIWKGFCWNVQPLLADVNQHLFILQDFDTPLAPHYGVYRVCCDGVTVPQVVDGQTIWSRVTGVPWRGFVLKFHQEPKGTVTVDGWGEKLYPELPEPLLYLGDIAFSLVFQDGGEDYYGATPLYDLNSFLPGAAFGLYIDSWTDIQAALETLTSGLPVVWGARRNGKWFAREFTPPSGTPDLVLTESEILDIEVEHDPELYWSVTVRGERNHTPLSTPAGSIEEWNPTPMTEVRRNWLTEEWREGVSQDSAIRDLHPLAESAGPHETCLQLRQHCALVAAKWRALKGVQRRLVRVSVKLLGLLVENVKTVQVNHAGTGLSVWLGRVVDIEEDYKQNRITLTLWG